MLKRLFALLLILTLVLSTLSACVSVAEISTSKTRKEKEDPTEEDTLPEQEEPDDALVLEICRRTEMQLLTSAVAFDGYYGYLGGTPAYYGNVDGDPEPELLFGSNCLYFDFTDEGRKTNIQYTPSGYAYFLDKDRNFYYSYGGGDIAIHKPDGTYISQEDGQTFYPYDNAITFGTAHVYSDHPLYYFNGEEVSKAEYDKQWSELGMSALADQSLPFVAYNYDGAYADALVQQLDAYFSEEFERYQGTFTGDFDNDGIEETLLIVENFAEPWFKDIMAKEDPMFKGLAAETISLVRDRLGFILIDPQGEQVQVRTHCLEGGDTVVDGGELTVKDNVICVGDLPTYMPVDPTAISYYKSQLEPLADANDWLDLTVQEVSVTGNDLPDFLCTYKKDGKVYVAVMIIRNGYVTQVYAEPLQDDTFIITQYNGKPAIFSYKHTTGQYEGKVYEDHYYCFMLFDRCGTLDIKQGENIASANGAIDEGTLNAFMDKLKQYLTDTQVFYDPYGISGTTVIPDGVTPPSLLDPEDTETTDPEKEMTKLEYWVENCHRMYLTEADLQGFSKEDCRIARNAVYAHSGRKFQDTTLTDYFNGYDWYSGVIDPNNFDQNILNDYQSDNLNLVIEFEKTMGYR